MSFTSQYNLHTSLPENFYKKYPMNSNKAAAAAAAAVHVVLLFHIFVWLTEIDVAGADPLVIQYINFIGCQSAFTCKSLKEGGNKFSHSLVDRNITGMYQPMRYTNIGALYRYLYATLCMEESTRSIVHIKFLHCSSYCYYS